MDEAASNLPKRTSQTIVRRVPGRAGSGKKASRLPYILLSLLLGAILWAGIDMKRMQDTDFVVDLALQQIMPADWKCTILSDDKIVVSARGAKQATVTIREDSLMVEPRFPVGAFDGDVFEGKLGIAPNQVRGLPPGVQAYAVRPDVISVRFDKVVTRYIAVETGDVTGTPADGFTVSRVARTEPSDLKVTAPKTLLDNLTPEDVIHTEPISIQGKKGVVKEWVKALPLVKNGQSIEVEGTVGVTIELTEEPMVKTLEQPIDVKALIDSPFERYGDLNLSPPVVSVTVSGSKQAVENLTPGEIVVYADIRERLPAAPGEYNMKCRFIAPARIQVVKIEPDTVKWITREAAGTAAED